MNCVVDEFMRAVTPCPADGLDIIDQYGVRRHLQAPVARSQDESQECSC